MMSGMSPETCWALNKIWNNKFYLQGCILLVISTDSYYDARIHEYQMYKRRTGQRNTRYENTKRKLYKTNAAIWFNKTCKDKAVCIIYTKTFTSLQYINQRLQIQFRAPDDERCAAGNTMSLQ